MNEKQLLKSKKKKDFNHYLSKFSKETEAENDLKLERDKLRAIIDGITSAGIGIDIIDNSYKIVYMNDVLKGIFGDCTGNICYKSYIASQEPCEVCPLISSIREKKIHYVEQNAANGHKYEIFSSPLSDPDGTINKSIEVIIDITERKLTQNAILQEKIFTEAALNAQRDTFFVFNPYNGKAIRWNKAFEALSGYTSEEIRNLKAPQSYCDKEDLKRAAIATEEIERVESSSIIMDLITKDGKRIPFEYVASSIKDEYDNVKYIVAIGRDITERLKIEHKLKVSEEKFKVIYENANDGILLSDINSKKFLTGNIKISEMLGYTIEELVDLGVQDIHPKDKLSYVLEQFEKQVKKEISIAKDIPIKKKNGNIFYADINSTPIRIGKKEYLIGVFRDITERKEAERLIIEENKKLLELDKMRHNLMTRISHELKTPLTSAYLASEFLLLKKNNLDANTAESIKTIHRGHIRLKSLIENLLNASRIESEKFKIIKHEQNIIKLLKQSLDDLDFLIKQRKLNLKIELPRKIHLMADKIHIVQLFTNIISNAIKNTPVGGEININLFENQDYYDFQIKDNGVGLTTNEIGILFEKFGKIERYGRGLDVDIEGSGLGLYLSKYIVEAHNGEILVKSEGRNKGSNFTIRLYKNK